MASNSCPYVRSIEIAEDVDEEYPQGEAADCYVRSVIDSDSRFGVNEPELFVILNGSGEPMGTAPTRKIAVGAALQKGYCVHLVH